jgi:hypothetical protein
MGRMRWWLLATTLYGGMSMAGDVEVVAAEFAAQGPAWRVNVTLRHPDSGWDHYADAWRITSAAGEVLGTRKLLHPHVDEQPFTRSLSGVVIPPEVQQVYVEGHDNVHGWAAQRLEVDLSQASGPGYTVRR